MEKILPIIITGVILFTAYEGVTYVLGKVSYGYYEPIVEQNSKDIALSLKGIERELHLLNSRQCNHE